MCAGSIKEKASFEYRLNIRIFGATEVCMEISLIEILPREIYAQLAVLTLREPVHLFSVEG